MHTNQSGPKSKIFFSDEKKIWKLIQAHQKYHQTNMYRKCVKALNWTLQVNLRCFFFFCFFFIVIFQIIFFRFQYKTYLSFKRIFISLNHRYTFFLIFLCMGTNSHVYTKLIHHDQCSYLHNIITQTICFTVRLLGQVQHKHKNTQVH